MTLHATTCHFSLSNVSDILNNTKVYKNILQLLTTLILTNVVVEIVCGFQSYDDYESNNPVVKLKNIQRSSEEAKLGDFKHHVFIYQKYKKNQAYRAFCAGSIITDIRVLTSAHCFFTNKKRRRRTFNNVRVVAGILYTLAKEAVYNDNQQWRTVSRIYTQRFFRFPSFNLAVLEVQIPWIFNNYVNKIPYTRKNQDFDGVCIGTAVKATRSWSVNKSLVSENLMLITRLQCEKHLRRNCFFHYCSIYVSKKMTSVETEGGGLICYGTGDPAEEQSGVLVGVTSLLSTRLPTMYNRIGLFHKWVTDGCYEISSKMCLKTSFLTLVFYYGVV